MREIVSLQRDKQAKKLVLDLREQIYALKKEIRKKETNRALAASSAVDSLAANCQGIDTKEDYITTQLDFDTWKERNYVWTSNPGRRKPPLDTRHPGQKAAFDSCKRGLPTATGPQTPLEKASISHGRFPRVLSKQQA